MNKLEKRIQQAFETLEPAPNLNKRTLDYILAAAPAQNATPHNTETVLAPFPAKKRRKHRRWVAGIAAAACLMVAALGLFTTFNQATAFVAIDINPSLELGVNRFGTVVFVQALNEDGETVLADLKDEGITLIGASYKESTARLASSNALASFADDSSFAQFSIVCDNESQAQDLQQASEDCFELLPCSATCTRASSEEREAAQEAGMGVGRYQVACQLIAQDPSYTLEDCSRMTMRQLRDALEDANPESGESSTAGTGRRQGAQGNQDGRGNNSHQNNQGTQSGQGRRGASENDG